MGPKLNPDIFGMYSFAQPAKSVVELLGGPLDGLLVCALDSSGFICAEMPRQAPALGVAGTYRVRYMRTGPHRFQHESTVVV